MILKNKQPMNIYVQFIYIYMHTDINIYICIDTLFLKSALQFLVNQVFLGVDSSLRLKKGLSIDSNNGILYHIMH